MLALVERPVHEIRRFQEPDLCEHGGWIMKRLKTTYTQYGDHWIANWLRNLLGMNDCLFLYRENGVALVQRIHTFQLEPKPIIWERFVWARDPKNEDQIEEAADFYIEIKRWAVLQEIDKIIVGESSDVPPEKIKARLGKNGQPARLYNLQLTYARV